ncbi:MAG: FAD-dependent oxidoreductase, partial [Oscillospiraceae bacterium]|nr:FAD-dependent oxidoreductase [Oscillospiraceae bacterium]
MAEQTHPKFYSKLSKKQGYSWETPPAPISESEIAETHETEVLVIGGGISGLAAAARLAEKGLKVDVIDKNDKQVSLAGQISGINSRYMRQHGIYIDPKKFA